MLNRIPLKKWIRCCLGALHRHWLRVVASATLALTLAVSLLVGNVPAYARDLGVGLEMENTYALMVSTGASPGTQVEFFGITYEGKDGKKRTEYIFPRKGRVYPGDAHVNYLDALSQIPSGNFVGKQQVQMRNNTGYGLTNNNTGYEILRENTTDTILFESLTPIKTVTDISFYGALNGKELGKWMCLAMNVYKVDRLYGFSHVGYFSTQNTVDFQGTLLAEADFGKGRTFDWSAGAAMFRSGLGTYTLKNTFTPEEAAYDSTKQKEYFFEVAFEDSYGAGIETLINADNKTTLANMQVYGAAALEVVYTDIYNIIHKVSMPLITNAVDWAISNGVSRNSVVNGIAQQGESIGFAGTLPNCKIINSYRIAYGAEMAGRETGVTSVNGGTLHQNRITQQKNTTKPDSVQLDYVAVYDLSRAQVVPVVEDSRLRYKKTGDPIRVDRRVGKQILPGEYLERGFSNYEPGKRLDSKDYVNSYLVTVKTDIMPFAGTMANIDMAFQYTDENGAAHWTDPYSLKKISRDYYGQLSMDGTEDIYPYLMSSKHEMQFVITLNDVARFTNFTVTMDNTTADEWQMNGLEIIKIDNLDTRSFKLEPWSITNDAKQTVGGDRTVWRNCTGKSLVDFKDKPVLVEPGKKVNVSLENSAVVPGEEEEELWDKEQRYEMSYEQAIKDLGMVRIRNTYQVSVNVADDLVTSTSDGDCGSKNLFYFQLVFKNGTSSYVLANQQLSADGFRAGVTEQFTISVNRNYGELTSVNIIPDDETSDSQTYDKLKINSIAVSRNGTGGVNKQWMINDVGWVAIDYREEGEEKENGVSLPRTENDLARSYLVDYTSYVINMQICINTGEYKIDPATNAKTPQFKGAVTAEIEYLNGVGEYRKQSFDVVQAMYNYAGKAPEHLGPNDQGIKLLGDKTVSNTSYMFRENSTDRFIIGINDVSELVSVTLQAAGTEPTKWNVKSLSASLIESDGPLQLNAQNEYQRKSITKEVAICTPEMGQSELSILNGQVSNKNMRFSPNKIVVKETEDSEWESTVSRVPDSLNDTLNVFLMPKGNGMDTEKYKVKCKIRYSSGFGLLYQTSERALALTNDKESSLLVTTGIPVTNINSPYLIELDVESEETLNDFLDYAVIQQVRSGVVVDTFFVKMGPTSTLVKQSYDLKDKTSMPKQMQFVDLKLGQDMATSYLVKENRDMAVAIQYTSSLTSDDKVLTSPYVFLTDREYKAISTGNTLRVTFNQPFVKDIVGISVAGTGGITAPVESATASVYTINNIEELEDPKSLTCTSWTNFFDPFKVDVKGTKIKGEIAMKDGKKGGKMLQTLELTFADMNGDRVKIGVPKNPVRMVINYLNTDNEIVEIAYDEMSKHQMAQYLSNNETNVPQTAVMLKDVSKIRYIYFEPYDDNDLTKDASWEVPCIYMEMRGPDKYVRYDDIVERTIKEGERYYLNAGNLAFDVSAQSYDEKTGIYVDVSANSEDISEDPIPKLNLQARSGETVLLIAQATNSKDEYITKVERMLTVGKIPQEGLLSADNGTLSFETPVNNTKENETYCVTISLKEMPQSSVTVNIIVLPEVKKATTEDETKPNTDQTDTPKDETKPNTGQTDTPKDETKPDAGQTDTPKDETKPDQTTESPSPSSNADAGQQAQNPTNGNQSTP